MGVWIFFPGGSIRALEVAPPWLRGLPGGSTSLCGDTWLGSVLSTAGGVFGAAYLSHVAEESVRGGVLSSVREFPCEILSALVRGRILGCCVLTRRVGDSGGGGVPQDRRTYGGGVGSVPWVSIQAL